MEAETKRGRNKRKVLAITAGFAAIGLGGAATLAAWTDSEWVFGGNGTGGPGVGTSSFSVQQNTVAPFAAGTWTDEPDNPGGEIVFGPDGLALTPGDSIYAAVALRTAPDSDAGVVELQGAVAAAGITTADPGDLLFDALDVRVVTDDALFTCDATAFTGAPGAPALIADGALDGTGGTATQALAADTGSTQYYCFEITLPAGFTPAAGTTVEDYMGRTVAPAWEFAAISS
jgi:predicted ribosomally synthesized peptide with SipW-like signal peptide